MHVQNIPQAWSISAVWSRKKDPALWPSALSSSTAAAGSIKPSPQRSVRIQTWLIFRCPERNALLKCGFLHEMISKLRLSSENREKSLPESSQSKSHLHRGRQRWDKTSHMCSQSSEHCLHSRDISPALFIKRFYCELITHTRTQTYTQHTQSHLVSRVCWLLHSVAMCVLTALQTQKQNNNKKVP